MLSGRCVTHRKGPGVPSLWTGAEHTFAGERAESRAPQEASHRARALGMDGENPAVTVQTCE